MKVLITGSNGTIGLYLVEHLLKKGINVETWNRSLVPPDDYYSMDKYIVETKPDALIHLAAITSENIWEKDLRWKINCHWPGELAWICRQQCVKFIFISSALVFKGDRGPYHPDSIPDASSGYGLEKRMAEEKVMNQNPDSVIIRLGWQICEKGTNTIIHFLDKMDSQKNKVLASTQWYPSCSFIEETVEVLEQSLYLEKGLYMFNSNSNWNFFEIASALKEKFKRKWEIIPFAGLVQDLRMVDERMNISDLRKYLPYLPDLA